VPAVPDHLPCEYALSVPGRPDPTPRNASGSSPEGQGPLRTARTEPPIALTTSLASIKGIGQALGAKLATLGLTNVGKLLAHLPMRHEKLEAESPIVELVPGQIGSARGEVANTRIVRRGKSRFEVVVVDDTDRLDAVWFNQPYLNEKIRPGMRIRLQGKCQRFGPGIQMVNPRFEILPMPGEENPETGNAVPSKAEPEFHDERLRPVYPASELINSRAIERSVAKVLIDGAKLIEDHLADEYRKTRDLPPLADAYRLYHAPQTEAEVAVAQRRLAYDELLLLQLGVHMKRAHLREGLRAPALRWSQQIDDHIRGRFPFTLTPSQIHVIEELRSDLTSPTPTNRLIQGDVGAGKTIVALYAMLLAVASRHQAAMMAPTEILAEQHFESISRMLAGSSVKIELLTGSTPKPRRSELLAALVAGEIDLLVGTHALLTENVRFKSLGVAIIDEQHRFGVHQRAALRAKSDDKGSTPHVIVMTATPIPRTMAITLFGDLDISTIKGLPPGRTPVKTSVISLAERLDLYAQLRPRLERGEQAFVVVPAIDPAMETDGPVLPEEELADVKTVVDELEKGPWKGLRVAALHGRLSRQTRDMVMERFRSGEIHAVVATTVIEVGVDIPNATMMIVENADRFGLAQLHQLRGRVGRGSKASACYLLADPATEDGELRLKVMESTADGFVLAEKDFEIRGPGELFGTRQSGLAPFKVADLMRDRDLLSQARRDAAEWIKASPQLDRPLDALARRRLLKAYGPWLGLGDVG
jgi:ATP-dependent DNA helicase RecG